MRFLTVTTAAFTLAACAGGVGSSSPNLGVNPSSPKPWVSGYYAGYYWDTEYPPDKVDMSAMTHIIYARAAPGSGSGGGTAGTLVMMSGTGDTKALPVIVSRAHAAHIKALLTIGSNSVSDGVGFSNSTATDAMRQTFATNIVQFCESADFDGIDLDWETGLDARNSAQVLDLIDKIHAVAASRPRYQGASPFLITFAWYWRSYNDAPMTPLTDGWLINVAAKVDQFNLMTYGMLWQGGGWDSWHFTAVDGASPTHPSSLKVSVDSYANSPTDLVRPGLGIPRSKIGIGIGFYAGAYTPSPQVSGPGIALDRILGAALGLDDNEWQYRRLYRGGYLSQGTYVHDDGPSKGSYRVYSPAYQPSSTLPGAPFSAVAYLTYEDEASIAAKGDWVKQTGLGGTIIWMINYGCIDDTTGANPLLGAVKSAFLQ